MEITHILFISKSILYKKIIKNAISELAPLAELSIESTHTSILKCIHEGLPPLIIIDTDMEDISAMSLTREILADFPQTQIALLCNEKIFQSQKLHHQETSNINYILKPLGEGYENNQKTITRGLRLCILKWKQSFCTASPLVEEKSSLCEGLHSSGAYSLILVAASTGGPKALEQVLSGITGNPNIPMLIIQHMPPGFTQNLANNLNKSPVFTVSEAQDGDLLKPGHAFLAPGGFHMKLKSKQSISLLEEGLVNGVRPSADVLFKSVAKHYKGEKILIVILTGMGRDGLEGVKALKKNCDCYCIAQDEESCIVYGMPRAIINEDMHDKIAHLDAISDTINRLLRRQLHTEQEKK